jgi:hypothetical protein
MLVDRTALCLHQQGTLMPICRSASLAAYWQVCTNLAIHSPDLTSPGSLPIFRPLPRDRGMNVNSLKSLKKRDKNCRIVRRKGRVPFGMANGHLPQE